jgi:4-alpha-glucanotransferase
VPEIINHALVLNLHQPSGNLASLLEHDTWAAKEILWAMDRMPRALWGYEDVARVHLSMSGTLLETLANQEFQQKVYGIVKCGDLLWHLQNTRLFEILGTGYYHPVLPLIPKDDWDEQCGRWLGIARHLFNRPQFNGFWPPEMGFSMEMIPLLRKFGYRYVMVDSNHVEPLGPMRWEEIRYKPHTVRCGNDEIIVVVRDRELSDAQEAGMDWGWFSSEVNQRTKWCDFVPLVTTCTDGDNGGWFRNTSGNGNFWDYFYKDYMHRIRANQCNIHPTFIDDYLDTYGAQGEVSISTGAWNTGWHNGAGFIQWTGSTLQKEALARVAEVSARFHEIKERQIKENSADESLFQLLNEAEWRLLRSETSCNFYWGEAMVDKCHSDLEAVEGYLRGIGQRQ